MIIRELRGKKPRFGDDCFIAENAAIIGDVTMGDQCSIWYNAVLRGDVHYIKLGNRVNVQDGAVIHGTYKKFATNIGDNVTIAHNAVVHGCTIKSDVLIGMGAIVMDDSTVESNTIIAAGSVVTQGSVLVSGSVYAGTPARKVKDISEELLSGQINRIAKSYVEYAGWYK